MTIGKITTSQIRDRCHITIINRLGISTICIQTIIMEDPCTDKTAVIDSPSTTKKWDKIEVTDHQCSINRWECRTSDTGLQTTTNTTRMTWHHFKSNICSKIMAVHQCRNTGTIMGKKTKIIWINEETVENMNNIQIHRKDRKDRKDLRLEEGCTNRRAESLFSTTKGRKYLKCTSTTLTLKWPQMMLSISLDIAVQLITGNFQEKMPLDKTMADTKDMVSFSSKRWKDRSTL